VLGIYIINAGELKGVDKHLELQLLIDIFSTLPQALHVSISNEGTPSLCSVGLISTAIVPQHAGLTGRAFAKPSN